MRRSCSLILALALGVMPIARGEAQLKAQGTFLEFSLLRAGFSGGGLERTTSGEVDFRPAAHYGLEARLTQRWQRWELSAVMGYSDGYLMASNGVIEISDGSVAMRRMRAALVASTRILRLGSGRLDFGVGPVFDRWSVSGGGGSKFAAGARAQLALGMPAGGVELRNTLGFDWSTTPFASEGLPSSASTRSLRAISFAFGVRFGL